MAKRKGIGVELHKLRPPKKIHAYNMDDQETIVDFTKNGKRLNYIFYILISTGMRFGEAAALTWDDVNLNNKTITISKTAVSIHVSMIIQAHAKTDHGNRTIAISDNVVDFLQKTKEDQNVEANYRNLVLPNGNYNVINCSNAILHWKTVCKDLGIEYSGMHALRHTWATRALEKGIDVKTVSEMLGHKNVITTMNIYQDVLHPKKQEAAELLNDLF